MGLYANYPIALAPGMGLNAFFTFTVVIGQHRPWPQALGVVFLAAVLFLVLSVLPVRERVVNAIPSSLKLAISAGIGLFLGIIALQQAGVIVAAPETMVGVGDLRSPTALLAAAGFAVMVALDARRVPGALIIAILLTTAVGVLLGVSDFKGVVSAPPSLAPTLLQMDLGGALDLGLAGAVLVLLFMQLFDNTGTLIGVAHQAGLLDEQGRLPRIGRALIVDSSAALVGAVLGTSTTTSYIESTAGVKAGGRTGLTALVVALLFLAALFFSPLAATVPGYATAPALLFVACLMARGLTGIDWEDATEYAPAMVTALTMPLTFSIADGVAFGLIAYAAIKLASGRIGDLNPTLIILALLCLARFAFL